uniref:Phosducin domain-containing protein n=1 Tax=Trichobilharzia regenti TaxID=157069 RepID=A0AA85ILJ9_TRIRE|nr:unnamed protein product [Trichobilharzia regenti]
MSLSLDDKLLGEKVHNYCSSSSEDEEEIEGGGEKEGTQNNTPELVNPPIIGYPNRPQTGPKGVVSDYKQFKKLEREKVAEKERKVLEYAKKHSLSCRPYSEDVKEKEKEQDVIKSSDDDSDDEFLTQYRQSRMNELMNARECLPTFNKIYDLTVDTFVREIDDTHKDTTVVVYIYENGNTSCAKVNACLDTIFQEYPHVKFCRIRASDARLSYKFSHHGVPAILVYKNGELIGNMLNITKDLGKEFYPNDLENYLIEMKRTGTHPSTVLICFQLIPRELTII